MPLRVSSFRHKRVQNKGIQSIEFTLPLLSHFIAKVACAKGLCKHEVLLQVYMSPFLSRWLCWHPDMSCLQSQIKLQYQLDCTVTKERVSEEKRIGIWCASQVANIIVSFLCNISCYSIIMCDWSPEITLSF